MNKGSFKLVRKMIYLQFPLKPEEYLFDINNTRRHRGKPTLENKLGVVPMVGKMIESLLRWFGRVDMTYKSSCAKVDGIMESSSIACGRGTKKMVCL